MYNKYIAKIIFICLIANISFADVDEPCPGFGGPGDAIYRLVRVLGMVNHHAAMFEGLFPYDGNWYMQIVEELGSSGDNPSGSDISNAQKINTQGYWQVFKQISHDPSDIDQLRTNFKNYFKKDEEQNYKGAFTSLEGLNNGTIGPNERYALVNSALQIFMNVDAGYTFLNLVQFDPSTFHWCCWWTDPPHDIYNIANIRCDFFPEWSYEILGFKVWGSCQSPGTWNVTTDYMNSDQHNSPYYGSYTCNELFPEIQNGSKNENGNDSKCYTTFRSSTIEPPDVIYTGMWSNQFEIWGEVNSTPAVFVAIEWSNDLVNWNWVQDDNGTNWCYNCLYCSVNDYLDNNYCGTSIICKRGSYDFYIPVNPWYKYNARYVRVTVLDQGSNYFTKVLDKNLGQNLNTHGYLNLCN